MMHYRLDKQALVEAATQAVIAQDGYTTDPAQGYVDVNSVDMLDVNTVIDAVLAVHVCRCSVCGCDSCDPPEPPKVHTVVGKSESEES